MAITLYLGSGSPFAWKVWLALEHKGLPHDTKVLSFQAGDLRTDEFAALNPRRKVPVLVDGEFALYESAAIIEYLEDQYPDRGPPLWPEEPRARALARRIAAEADGYFYPAGRRLMVQTLFRPDDDGDPDEIAAARDALAKELARWEQVVGDGWLAGELGAADFAFYPQLAMVQRLAEKRPRHGVAELIGPRLTAYAARMRALPIVEKTWPPHWK